MSMNPKILSLIEKLEKMSPEKIQTLTAEQKKLLEEFIIELQLYLIKRIHYNMTVNDEKDYFWKDLGLTFLGL